MRPGRGFDGSQGQDFGEFLRRELHAAGDQIQPGADGLEQIREKIRSRSAHATGRHGVMAIWGAIAAFGTQLVRYLGSGVRRLFPAGQRAPERRAPKQPRDWREAMLRPAFATGLAVFTLGVVLAIVPTTRSDIAHLTSNFGSVMSGSTSASSGPDSTGSRPIAPGSSGAGPSSSNFASMPSTKATCPPTSTHASATPTTSGSSGRASSPAQDAVTTSPAVSSSGDDSSAAASTSASPSDSGSPSPSNTATPSPSPSGTATSSPSPSPSATATSSPSQHASPSPHSGQGRARAHRPLHDPDAEPDRFHAGHERVHGGGSGDRDGNADGHVDARYELQVLAQGARVVHGQLEVGPGDQPGGLVERSVLVHRRHPGRGLVVRYARAHGHAVVLSRFPGSSGRPGPDRAAVTNGRSG